MRDDNIRVGGVWDGPPIPDSMRYPYGLPEPLTLPPMEEELELNEGSPSVVVHRVQLEDIQDPVERQAELNRRFSQALLQRKSVK